MNELRYNLSFLDLDYHQAYHTDLIRQTQGGLQSKIVQSSQPSLWDTVLFRTGDILVSLGERLRRNRASLQLSEECQC